MFFILLAFAVFFLLLPPELHQKWGEWPARIVAALSVLAVCAYATDKFRTKDL